MPTFDMMTALQTLNLLMMFALGVVLLTYNKYRKQVRGIVFYMLFYIFSILCTTLMIYREDIGPFLSVIVANSFMYFGVICLAIGMRHFQEKVIPWKWYATSFVVYVLLFVYFTYIQLNVEARIIVYSVFAIGVLGDCFYIELQRTKIIGKGQNIMLSVITVLIGTQIFRIARVLIHQEGHDNFFDFNLDAFSVFILGVSYLLISYGMLESISSRFGDQIAESERSLSSLLGNLPGFAYRCKYDEYYTMEILSESFETLTGYQIDDVIDNKRIRYIDFIEPSFVDDIRATIDQAVIDQTSFVLEYKIILTSGDRIWVWEQGKAIYDKNNNVIALEGYIANINERKNMEQNLEYLSYRDFLTGLYNRRYIEAEMQRLDVERNLPISVIMADLNGLKFINDSFGHKEGDALLQLTAKLFQSTLRQNELISRLGGDEFLIFMEQTTLEESNHIIQRFQNELEKDPYHKKGLSISFGVHTKTSMDQDLTSVLKKAEDHMYETKIYQRPSSRRKAVDSVLGTLFEKDKLSEEHSHQVSKYSRLLAKKTGLSTADVDKITTAALLHDVGKIIIDTNILTKQTTLTEDEYNEIKKHPEIGFRILSNVAEFQEIATIIMHHHERPDGKGYPGGLTEKDIPLESRIISIADAYDAMVGQRMYRDKMSVRDAITELQAHKGTQFDAELVDLFVEIIQHETKKTIDE